MRETGKNELDRSPEKNTANAVLEKNLWDAADQFRAKMEEIFGSSPNNKEPIAENSLQYRDMAEILEA